MSVVCLTNERYTRAKSSLFLAMIRSFKQILVCIQPLEYVSVYSESPRRYRITTGGKSWEGQIANSYLLPLGQLCLLCGDGTCDVQPAMEVTITGV